MNRLVGFGVALVVMAVAGSIVAPKPVFFPVLGDRAQIMFMKVHAEPEWRQMFGYVYQGEFHAIDVGVASTHIDSDIDSLFVWPEDPSLFVFDRGVFSWLPPGVCGLLVVTGLLCVFLGIIPYRSVRERSRV